VAGWKLAQLHDVDVVPCYHVNGCLNVLGRDKRVCSPTIYVVDDKFGAIDPAGESRSDTFFERRRGNPWLSLKFEDNLTIDIPDLFAKWTFSFLSTSTRDRAAWKPRLSLVDDRRYGTWILAFWTIMDNILGLFVNYVDIIKIFEEENAKSM